MCSRREATAEREKVGCYSNKTPPSHRAEEMQVFMQLGMQYTYSSTILRPRPNSNSITRDEDELCRS